MFKTIKEQVDILEVAEEMFDRKFVPIGDKTFQSEDRECPFCSHKDCFRIKQDGDESVFKCFSCDVGGDVTEMVAAYKKVDTVDAAKLLVKRFDLKLPKEYSPIQEIFNTAAAYYHNLLGEAGPAAELGGQTPLEFQLERRKHTKEGLDQFRIGWSDGGLIEYLESLGFEKSLIQDSGLMNKKGKDFLPAKSFIYPHFVNGRVSHFTFKDPAKRMEYQLPNKNKLNGHSFYNSDSIRREGPVIIVEGENDTISIFESNWNSGVICCNGSISASQLEWIATNLSKRDVITIYDSDAAGDKYREKTFKVSSGFNSLLQVKLSGVKDIDEYLKAGGDLTGAINSARESAPDEGSSVEIDNNDPKSIVEKGGAYFKIRQKDGNEYHIKLSNFVIQLRNIYIRNGERERDVILVREDGLKSSPVKVNSDCKVSLKSFKTLISNAIDASFYGKEEDLTAVWEYVYDTYDEKIVHLPDRVGRIPEFGGWLFRDLFVSDTGARYEPDEDGVIWITNNSVGLKPISLVTGARDKGEMVGIPSMKVTMTEEEREQFLQGFIDNLGKNIGSIGDALTVVGWAWASLYCHEISKATEFFPLLYFWGRFGKGKSSIVKWVESFYNMEDSGYTTFPQLNSGVSFSRKLSYYSSLPMCVDELRADREAAEWYGTFRSWYGRTGKATGTREGFGVNELPIHATLMFAGEEQFTDPATRSRCIPIKVSAHGRETVDTFKWINNRKMSLNAIGYHWVMNYGKISKEQIIKEFLELEAVIKKAGVPDRTARNWSIAAIFAIKLCQKYFPKFNYVQYLIESTMVDVERQQEDDTLMEFWQIVEGMQVAENSKISGDHMRRDGETLYVWFAEVFRLTDMENRFTSREKFTKRAILEAIKEESYFMEETRVRMGVSETMRRVIKFDLTKAPDSLQNIGSRLG